MERRLGSIQLVGVTVFFCLFTTAALAQEYKELRGTWENPEYTQGVWKIIIEADGSYESFAKAEASESNLKGKCKIVEKWKDSEGCNCYKTILHVGTGAKSYCLMKISASGKALEYVEDPQDFPKFFHTEVYRYRKLYRK